MTPFLGFLLLYTARIWERPLFPSRPWGLNIADRRSSHRSSPRSPSPGLCRRTREDQAAAHKPNYPSNRHKFPTPSPSRRRLTQVDTFASVNPLGPRPGITLNLLLERHFSIRYDLPEHVDVPCSVNHGPPRLSQRFLESLSLTAFREIPRIPIQGLRVLPSPCH